ncbi:MAG TPA: toprim domain-containing protein [Candidatus Paceibacterota bacterium]|nr:toprim domain-containing protein [Candidatus Paceibacterota bacterium]
MDSINQLTDLFKKFPGIGPRQARRFVYYLLTTDQNFLDQLSNKIKDLKQAIKQCSECQRYFSNNYNPKSSLCKICSDIERDKSSLLIVEKDVDLEAVEKSGSYRGYYFVLGGAVPILDPNPETHVRFPLLLSKLEAKIREGLSEIIIALPVTTEGDHTAHWLATKLHPLAEQAKIKISFPGRGLSTGSELEYADIETIKNALANRQ